MNTGNRADLREVRGWRDESGAAAVEFAFVLPVLLLLVFGIVEFGRAWNVRQTLTDAAREGARVAAVNNGLVTPASALQDSVSRTVRRTARRVGLDSASLVIAFDAAAPVGGAAGTPVRVSLEYKYSPLFGSWVLPQEVLTIRTYSVMRNE